MATRRAVASAASPMTRPATWMRPAFTHPATPAKRWLATRPATVSAILCANGRCLSRRQPASCATRQFIRGEATYQINPNDRKPLPSQRPWTYEDIMQVLDSKRDDVIFVDVREPHELYETGKIPGAINIPITTAVQSFHVDNEDFEAMYGFRRPGTIGRDPKTGKLLPRKHTLVFYCKAGVRARSAMGLAENAGFRHLASYDGSWLDWEKRNGPVEKVVKGVGDGGAGVVLDEPKRPDLTPPWVKRQEAKREEKRGTALDWDPNTAKFTPGEGLKTPKPREREQMATKREESQAKDQSEPREPVGQNEAAADSEPQAQTTAQTQLPIPEKVIKGEEEEYWDPYRGKFVTKPAEPMNKPMAPKDDPRLIRIEKGDPFYDSVKSERKDVDKKKRRE